MKTLILVTLQYDKGDDVLERTKVSPYQVDNINNYRKMGVNGEIAHFKKEINMSVIGDWYTEVIDFWENFRNSKPFEMNIHIYHSVEIFGLPPQAFELLAQLNTSFSIQRYPERERALSDGI